MIFLAVSLTVLVAAWMMSFTLLPPWTRKRTKSKKGIR
jgi:hypothetical protein